MSGPEVVAIYISKSNRNHLANDIGRNVAAFISVCDQLVLIAYHALHVKQ